MIRSVFVAIALATLAGCADAPPAPVAPAAPVTGTTRPRAQDDFYGYVNADWIAAHAIPPDRAIWGAFPELRDRAEDRVRHVIDEARAAGDRATPEQRKLADLHASFMDEARIEDLGAKPLAAPLAVVDALRSKREIPATIAAFNRGGINAPFAVRIDLDAREPSRMVPIVFQSGLGMPDRDYYLRDDDARLVEIRRRYEAHLARLLALAGAAAPDESARQALAVETALARAQWTRVESRDPVRTYNKVPVRRLDALTPGFAWPRWLAATGIAGRADALVVSQPSYLQGLARAIETLPLEAWRAYFQAQAVAAYAPYLSKPFADADFAFNGQVLADTPQPLPRDKRSMALVEIAMGQAAGRLYVAKYFPPAHKARMDALVRNLLAAFHAGIDGLDWMSPETKREAQGKLARFGTKIAYPTSWRDYGALAIRRDDLVGNVQRARRFEFERQLARLGRPVDRAEWFTTPQTVNAYYSGGRNEIVFPAGILQPPFFDPDADDATNYGAIGAVIGHEISHGFDDRGSQFDGEGRLRDWWTEADRRRFGERTRAMVKQYDAFESLPGYRVNGSLTLGENIADNAGLAVAWRAYQLSLAGKPALVVDGTTGAQRFYVGFAKLWRIRIRDAERIRRVKVDPHSPGEARVKGTLANQDPFFAAFDVKPGDGMWVAPEQRIKIW